MPQHHPEDRVRVKNIVSSPEDDIQTFYINRVRKERVVDVNGIPSTRDFPYEQEILWNFKKGFFFIWGGKPYVLAPGQEKTYPRFLANHCAKQQVQYILNKRHQATKQVLPTGIIMYDQNILKNKVLAKQLTDQVIVGVEEWYEGAEDDFDAIVNKEFGGDIDSYMTDEPTNKEDFTLPEVDDYEEITKEEEAKVKKPIPRSSNKDLQTLRDECDASGVEWEEGDNVDQLKGKLVKMMA